MGSKGKKGLSASQKKDEKIKKRRKHGSLPDNLVKKETLSRYRTALMLFLLWLQSTYKDVFPTSYEALDEVVSQMINELWENG